MWWNKKSCLFQIEFKALKSKNYLKIKSFWDWAGLWRHLAATCRTNSFILRRVQGSRRSFTQTQVAHSGCFLLRRPRPWGNQTHGGQQKHNPKSHFSSQMLNIFPAVVRRCVGGSGGARRKDHGLRKPKMLWWPCQRKWTSPSYPDLHLDPLPAMPPPSPNGTLPSRWGDAVPTVPRCWCPVYSCSSTFDPQGRFDALMALLRRQYDRVAIMRPTSQDKVRNQLVEVIKTGLLIKPGCSGLKISPRNLVRQWIPPPSRLGWFD